MKTGSSGTFVISWSQTELDGFWAAPMDGLRVGTTWAWTGEAVRVDGPAGILPLGEAMGAVDLRRRAAQSVRRLLKAVEIDTTRLDEVALDPAPDDQSFTVTDGHKSWTITIIEGQGGQARLCMFLGDPPPRHTDLWVVTHSIDMTARDQAENPQGGVICFTPGTMIMTEEGAKPVEQITEGDRVQTKDNGCQPVLWTGKRRVTGARLYVMPHLAPIRLLPGALGPDIPDLGLLVSPDHRVVIRGGPARALFNAQEVLVAARDLIDDRRVFVDRSVRAVSYHHMLLPAHEVVFANNVATESFHPASSGLDTLSDDDRSRLLGQMPDLAQDVTAYGAYARRMISATEAAILRHDLAA